MITPPISPPTNDHKSNNDVPKSQSPVRVSVITTPKVLLNTPLSDLHSSPSSSSPFQPENPLEGLTNGIPHPPSTPKSADSKTTAVTGAKEVKTKAPQTIKSPLSPEINFDPSQYKYIVEYVSNPAEPKLTVRAVTLSRPKGVLTPKKLKLFLRNATYRSSDKHPFAVKVSVCVK